MALMLERKASKDEILELYLNDVYLGQRGSFAHPRRRRSGAAVLRQGRQQPHARRSGDDRRRDPVAVACRRSTTPERAQGAAQRRAAGDGRRRLHHRRTPPSARPNEPLAVVQRALDAEAPYFVDYVGQTLDEQYPGLDRDDRTPLDVYTTLDLHLQRLAQDARARRADARRRAARADASASGKAQAALIAVDPRTGEILAFVGGRSYNQSQYNRAVSARRQPGSVFKPFVYLAAFEQRRGRGPHRPHAGDARRRRADDVRRSTTRSGRRELRERVRRPDHAPARARAFAQPRDDQGRRADRLRQRRGALEAARRRHARRSAYPSIALGVFEATPFEIATAYTLFPERRRRSGRSACSHDRRAAARRSCRTPIAPPTTIARPDTTFLVDEHDAQRAQRRHRRRRARGRLHARRRRQDRHDQRPARRLVRRLHAGAADGGLGRLRRQPAARPERRAGGAADLDAVHDDARSPATPNVPFDAPDGHHLRRHRPRHRQARRRPPARASSTKRSSPAPSRRSLRAARRSSAMPQAGGQCGARGPRS